MMVHLPHGVEVRAGAALRNSKALRIGGGKREKTDRASNIGKGGKQVAINPSLFLVRLDETGAPGNTPLAASEESTRKGDGPPNNRATVQRTNRRPHMCDAAAVNRGKVTCIVKG